MATPNSSREIYSAIEEAVLAAISEIAKARGIELSRCTRDKIVQIQQGVADLLGKNGTNGVAVAATAFQGRPAITIGAPFSDREGLLEELIAATDRLGNDRIHGHINDKTFAATHQ